MIRLARTLGALLSLYALVMLAFDGMWWSELGVKSDDDMLRLTVVAFAGALLAFPGKRGWGRPPWAGGAAWKAKHHGGPDGSAGSWSDVAKYAIDRDHEAKAARSEAEA